MQVDLKFGRSWGDAKHSWEELNGIAPTKPKPEPKPKPKPEPKPEPKPKPKPEPQSEPKPESSPSPNPQPKSKPEPKPRSPANDAPKQPPPRPTEKKTPPPLSVELTKLTKVGGPLTKRISLAPDGTLKKDGSACVMAHGTAERVQSCRRRCAWRAD